MIIWKFLKYNFTYNWGLLFHLIVMLLFTKAMICFFPDIPLWAILFFNMVVAINWEAIEFIRENDSNWENVKWNYTTLENYWFDTIGDIIIPLIICWIVYL